MATIRVGINGFGRIGRNVFRACLDESTKAANLCVSAMFAQDAPAPPRKQGEKIKLPKRQKPKGYVEPKNRPYKYVPSVY